MTPKKLKGSDPDEMNIEQIHQIIHNKNQTNIGHSGNPTSFGLTRLLLFIFEGGGKSRELKWDVPLPSLSTFVSLNGTHQASNALHTNIIQILTFQENTYQDTPPCHLEIT